MVGHRPNEYEKHELALQRIDEEFKATGSVILDPKWFKTDPKPPQSISMYLLVKLPQFARAFWDKYLTEEGKSELNNRLYILSHPECREYDANEVQKAVEYASAPISSHIDRGPAKQCSDDGSSSDLVE